MGGGSGQRAAGTLEPAEAILEPNIPLIHRYKRTAGEALESRPPSADEKEGVHWRGWVAGRERVSGGSQVAGSRSAPSPPLRPLQAAYPPIPRIPRRLSGRRPLRLLLRPGDPGPDGGRRPFAAPGRCYFHVVVPPRPSILDPSILDSTLDERRKNCLRADVFLIATAAAVAAATAAGVAALGARVAVAGVATAGSSAASPAAPTTASTARSASCAAAESSPGMGEQGGGRGE